MKNRRVMTKVIVVCKRNRGLIFHYFPRKQCRVSITTKLGNEEKVEHKASLDTSFKNGKETLTFYESLFITFYQK